MQAKVRISQSQVDAIELADQLRIHPAIVAGRVRKETNNWRLLSRFISDGGSVSRLFEN
jgi:HTH-type transcriptional regulator/antitoxin HigA